MNTKSHNNSELENTRRESDEKKSDMSQVKKRRGPGRPRKGPGRPRKNPQSKKKTTKKKRKKKYNKDEELRHGTLKHSPLFSTQEQLIWDAKRAFRIIRDRGRTQINFQDILVENNAYGYRTPCMVPGQKEMWDTRSGAVNVGNLDDKEYATAQKARSLCRSCPFRTECLAISFTCPTITNFARHERILPGSEDGPVSLTMADYLIFGSYMPQERKTIYNYTCDLLEAYDLVELAGKGTSRISENQMREMLKIVQKNYDENITGKSLTSYLLNDKQGSFFRPITEKLTAKERKRAYNRLKYRAKTAFSES